MSEGVKGALIGAFGAIAAAVLAALIGHSAGVVYIGAPPATTRVSTPSLPATTGLTTGPAPRPTSTSLLPEGVSVRRSTGSVPIKLSVGYGVDLDDNVSPNWSVKSGPATSSAGYGSDVVYGGGAGDGLAFDSDAAVESNATGYATCAQETDYSSTSIAQGNLQADLQAGKKICVRTDGNRYALLTIISVSTNQLEFSAIAWDPPFQSQ